MSSMSIEDLYEEPDLLITYSRLSDEDQAEFEQPMGKLTIVAPFELIKKFMGEEEE